MAKTKFIDIGDGDGICFESGQEFYLTCCDCLLTHKITTRLVGNEATMFICRDDRRTAQKRRRKKESVEQDRLLARCI